MDEDMDRTPHPEEPAEGAGAPDERRGSAPGEHGGAPEDIPEHNTAPDGQEGVQGSAPLGGDEDPAPLGGDETTAEQLGADNAVEEDSLRTLAPDDAPA